MDEKLNVYQIAIRDTTMHMYTGVGLFVDFVITVYPCTLACVQSYSFFFLFSILDPIKCISVVSEVKTMCACVARISEVCSIYNLHCAICHKQVIPYRMNMRRICRKRGSVQPANPALRYSRVLPRYYLKGRINYGVKWIG